MGFQKQARAVFAAILFTAACSAFGADCDDLKEMSVPGFKPNRPVGSVAWIGSTLGVTRTNIGVPAVLTRFDENLNQLGETTVSSSSVLRDLMLVSGGGEFAAVFISQSGAIIFQEINASGVRVGPEIQVGAAHGIFPNQQFDAAYNSQLARWEILYSIPFNINTGIWVTSIPLQSAGNGAILDRQLEFSIGVPPLPKIAVASDGSVAVSWFRLITEIPTYCINVYDGQYNLRKINLLSSNVQKPHLAAAASGFALLYQAVIGGNTELRWVRTDSTGTAGAEARVVTGTGIDVVPVGILWNATLSEWAIGYEDAYNGDSVQDGDYRIRRLTSGGSVISDTLFTSDQVKRNIPGRYSPVWSGGAYYSSIERTPSDASGSLSYIVKHCPLGGIIAVRAAAPVPFQPFTFSAGATGGQAPFAYAWDFGDLSAAPGQTVSHQYGKTGTYTVTLTVTDLLGDKTVKSTQVVVVDNIRRRSAKK